MSYVSLSTRCAIHLSTKNYWLPYSAPELLAASVRPRWASFHQHSARLRPPISDHAVYQLRTIRNVSPLSFPLCLRRFFSRKTRFYRYPRASRNPLARYLVEGNDRDVRRREITRVRLSESQQRRNLAALHGDTIHYGLPDVRHDLYHVVHIVAGTNLPAYVYVGKGV